MATPPKGPADNLKLGDWNAVCFRCGAKRKASQLQKQWQGYYVCPNHWEPRHPQDFVRATTDDVIVPWSQRLPDIELGVCSLIGAVSIAGYGIAGCLLIGYTPPNIDDIVK